MKIHHSSFLIRNSARIGAFTLIELLVVITIIGILITLVMVAVVPIQRKSRDARRKADVNNMLSAANLFKADFKIYPNTTFNLGNYGTAATGDANSNYGISGDVFACDFASSGATSTFLNPVPAVATPGKPTVNELDTKPLVLNPGFVSINNFLICLKYTSTLLSDPKPASANNQDKYQYRVSYDYGDVVVTALLENSNDTDATQMFTDALGTVVKRYYKGSGVVVRHLDDSSDVSGFFSSLAGNSNDGFYLYQCKNDSAGNPITKDNRVTNEPITNGTNGYVANPSCQQNSAGGLDVIAAF